jgi:hypothetical protein
MSHDVRRLRRAACIVIVRLPCISGGRNGDDCCAPSALWFVSCAWSPREYDNWRRGDVNIDVGTAHNVPETESERLRRVSDHTFTLAEAAPDEQTRLALYQYAVYLAQAAAEESVKEQRQATTTVTSSRIHVRRASH